MAGERDNVFDFDADLRAFAAKTNLQIDAVVKRVVFDLFRRIVVKTAIDTGRAAGSWNVAKGAAGSDSLPPAKEPGTYPRPNDGDIASKLDGVSFSPAEGVYWIYNNLEYIETLEYGLYPSDSKTGKTSGGFSIQTPDGMVRVSLAEVETDLYETQEAPAP